MHNHYGNGPYDGSWGNDPYDLRCIRLDAEMEERYSPKPVTVPRRKPRKWEPQTIEQLEEYMKKCEESDELIWEAMYCNRKTPRQYWFDYQPCDIADKDGNIVDNTCCHPEQAKARIKDLPEEHGPYEIWRVTSYPEAKIWRVTI